MPSTIYPAHVALKDQIEAWTWPAPGAPSVAPWGQPTESDDQTLDSVYFGDVEGGDEFRVLGADRVDEEFRIRLVVDVRRYGDDEQATVERAWQVYEELLKLIHDDLTLGGSVSRITGYRLVQGATPNPQHWRAQVVLDVACVGLFFFS